MPTVGRILFLILLVYLGYMLLMVLFQRNMLYPGRSLTPAAIPSGVAATAEKFWVITSFGKVEARLWIGKGLNAKPAVIYFHGNGELVDSLTPDLEELGKLGFAIMLVEYPGYGRSSGRPHERSLTEAAVAAYDMLVQRPEIDPAKIVSFGFSLGCGPAVALATQRPVKALVLAAPLASLRPFAQKRLLPAFLLHDKFDNAVKLRQYTGPVLVLHGRQDSIIPFRHGEMVAGSSVNSTFIPLLSDHNDLMDNPEFWKTVAAFLQSKVLSARK